MPYRDPFSHYWAGPPRAVWIDPNHWYYREERRYVPAAGTTTSASPSVDEERVRRIVREEIADIVPIDVPDTPPEG